MTTAVGYVGAWRQADKTRERLWLFAFVAGLLALWQLTASLVPTGQFLFPTPTAVAHQLWLDRALYWPNAATTLNEAGQGLGIGVGVAVVLALAFVRSAVIEKLFMGAALATYCVPTVAIAPIVAVIFTGEKPKVVLAALAVVFPMLVATIVGLRSADPTSVAMVRAFGGGSRAIMFKVRVRAGLPSFFAGLRVAGPAAILGAMIGEYLGGDSGLGVAMIAATQSFQVERVWGIAIVASALSLAIYLAVSLIARRFWVAPSKAILAASNLAVSRWSSRGPRLLSATVRATSGFLLSAGTLAALWAASLLVLQLDPYFAKTPADIATYLSSGPAAGADRAILFDALGTTLASAVPGFVIGVAGATGLAMLLVQSPTRERAVMPVAVALQAAPILAMTPLIVLTFGRDLRGVTAIVVISTFFPTLVNVMRGLRSASADAIDVVRVGGGSRFDELRRVQLPSALPSLFASMRIAVPGALFGTMLAEWIATGNGIGYLVVISGSTAKYDQLWAGVALVTATSLALYNLVGLLESIVLRRYSPEQLTR